MLISDNATTANTAAEIFQHADAIQFHDPNRLVGKEIAESLGAHGSIAWDMYLFYETGSEWGEEPPIPFDWAHQLDDLRIDPNRFAWDDELRVRLRRMISALEIGGQ